MKEEKIDSLLDNQEEVQETLDTEMQMTFADDDSSSNDSFVEDNDVINQSFVPSDEDVKEFQKVQLKNALKQQASHIVKTPAFQADMMFNNYMKSGNAPKYLSGSQKRQLKRQLLRNARAGKYNHIFNQEYSEKFAEELGKQNGLI